MNACIEDNVLGQLLELLKLEKIEENIFRGQSQDLGFGNVFGGQVLGQALSAAYRTVSPERRAHSLHASSSFCATQRRCRNGKQTNDDP